jgi:hypothetical protein
MQNNVYVPTQWAQAERKSAVDSYRYRKREVERKREVKRKRGGGVSRSGHKKEKEMALKGNLKSRCDFLPV